MFTSLSSEGPPAASCNFKAKDPYLRLAYEVRGLTSAHLSSLGSHLSPLLSASRHTGCLSGHLSAAWAALLQHFTELAPTDGSGLNPHVCFGEVFLAHVKQMCDTMAHGSLYSSSTALSKSTVVYIFVILFYSVCLFQQTVNTVRTGFVTYHYPKCLVQSLAHRMGT